MSLQGFERLRSQWRTPGLVPGYELLNVLGAGGQGIVFKARKEAISRTYVVKFLRPQDGLEPAGWRTGELDHVATLAELRHPHLVSIEDRGEALGHPYLVLEYAGDRTLRDLIAQGALGLDDGLRLVGQTAQALEYLHGHGVLHLDVKPSNVFVLDGRAKLGDFGLVQAASATGPLDIQVAIGTPPYAAPEMVSLARASAACDVFGLARTLDDLVIAACSRSGHEPPRALLSLIDDAIHDEPRRRPSMRAFRERLASLPPARRRITFRALSAPAAPPAASSPPPLPPGARLLRFHPPAAPRR